MSEPNTQQTNAMAETPVTPPQQQTNAQPTEKTFTQEELDAIVEKRLARVKKGMPTEEELSAFRAWKENQQTEQQKQEAKSKELSEAKTALAAAEAKLEQYEREKFLLSKGVPAEDVDYYVFKIGKLVTETVDFETAAKQYIKEHTPQEPAQGQSGIRVDFTAPLSGGGHPMTLNERINNRLRGR